MVQYDESYNFFLPPRLCTQDGKTIPHLKAKRTRFKQNTIFTLKKVNLLILVSKYSTDVPKLSTKTKLNWVPDMISLNKKEMTIKQNVFHHIQKTSSKFG